MGAVEDYLADLPPDRAEAMARVRAIVLDAYPDAGEGTSYGMPAFTYRDRPLLAFQSWKAHIGLYPCSGHVVAAVADELGPDRASKGTVKFTPDDPVPEPVLREMLRLRAAEIDGGRR